MKRHALAADKRTRCGIPMDDALWTEDESTVTCERCQKVPLAIARGTGDGGYMKGQTVNATKETA